MATLSRSPRTPTIDAAAIAPRDLDALRREGGAPFVLDVRSPMEFEGEHIEGARLIPFEQVAGRLDEIPEDDVVVVCRAGIRAAAVAETLAHAGRRARVLDGGMNAWRQAGLAMKVGRKRLPVDRQVQLIAGSLVLVGVALGAFVTPWFLLVSAFFGGGLLFAGATGTCGLAHVLMRMPWNRLRAAPDAGPPEAKPTTSKG